MDHKNFQDETFEALPEHIECSNFTNCTFNAGTHFDRCNIMKCTITVPQDFLKSNILGCNGAGLEGSRFVLSNNDPDWEPDNERTEA